jgi:hypothetical protein
LTIEQPDLNSKLSAADDIDVALNKHDLVGTWIAAFEQSFERWP